MTIVLAFLGTVIGAALGGAIGFFVYILLAYATGADDQQGAIAMGAAMAGLPLGGVIGAILGCILVLRWRAKAGASLVGGRAGWIAMGVTVAVLVGLYGTFLWQPPKPVFKPPGSAPIVKAEIRLPGDMVDQEYIQGRKSHLRTYAETFYEADKPFTLREEGDVVIIETEHQLLYRRDNRAINVWVNSGRKVVYELRVGDEPAPTNGFTGWQPISALEPGFYTKEIPPDEITRVSIRTQVVAP